MTSNAYQIWLTYDGEKEKFQFPVHPEQINLKQGSSNESVDIVGLGEVTIMQEKPEAEVSWSSFFPSIPFSGIQVGTLLWPEQIKVQLKTWMGSKKPCHLIITGTKINMFCTIEQFDCNERGGAIGELNYDITLKEYRQPTIRQVTLDKLTQTASVSNSEERTDNTIVPTMYAVVFGDTLYSIAKRKLYDAERWTEIASLNGLKPPYKIFPKQILKLPI